MVGLVRMVGVVRVVGMVGLVGMVGVVRVTWMVWVPWMVGVTRMVGVVGMIRKTRTSTHRIVSAWRRRVRIASAAMVGSIVEGIAGGDVLSDVRRRVARVVGIAIHVGRSPRRRERILTIRRSGRRRNAQSALVGRFLLG